MNKKGFSLPVILFTIVAVVLLVGGGFILGSQINKPSNLTIQPTPSSTIIETVSPSPNSVPLKTSSPTLQPEPAKTTQSAPVVNGTALKDIKFALPQGWSAKLNGENGPGLFIAPNSGGGFLNINIYNYSGNTGRREYYCQVTKDFCIEGTTYFSEMNIGNISGYVAHAIDNSGGGDEYFGSKGNKFYIISTFTPSAPIETEFDKNYKNVLNSLIF